jgi:lauroyl/myristoyl acyltransferase
VSRILFKGAESADTGDATGEASLTLGAPVAVKPMTARDLVVLAALPISAAIAWTVPQTRWQALAHACAPIAARLLATRLQAKVERIERLVGDRPLPMPAAAVAEESIAGHVEEFLQILREYRPRGWQPAIALEGREHVAAALERGRGAILWVGHFSFASLVAKKAFHGAGLEVSHLSHPSHGFSRSRFGMRFLNPVRAGIEERYVRERVMLSIDGPTAALRGLHRRLRHNGVVSITVRERALRPAIVPFLDGTIKLASGAADLAYATRAALLPVFAVREPDGRHRVIIEPPLELRRDLPRAGAVDLALRQYSERLAPRALAYPGQWRGWLHL